MMLPVRFLILFLSFTYAAAAQQPFVEGRIKYSVNIGPVSDNAGYTEHAGTYTIIVKGNQIRKELDMNTGYQSIILINTNMNTAYSLQSHGGQRYAIQLSMDDLLKKQQAYQGFTQKDMTGKMTIASLPCEKTIITYKDGTTSVLYYTTAWLAPAMPMFDRFPGIQYVPLSFEYRNEEGITMHFQAEQLEASPIESALFRIPPDYKLISNEEYKKQKH